MEENKVNKKSKEFEVFQIDLSEYGMGESKLVVMPDLNRCFLTDCFNVYTEVGLTYRQIENLVNDFLSSQYKEEIRVKCYTKAIIGDDGNEYAFCDILER